MSFLLLDRVVSLDLDQSIVALKNVTLSDEIFRDHFVGRPVMPASLLIESLHQAATVLLEVSSEHRLKAIPVLLDQAKFRALVRPGDQLRIGVAILTQDAGTAQLDATIHVAERLVASARLTFALREAGEFYPPHARPWVDSTYHTWLEGARITRAGQPPP